MSAIYIASIGNITWSYLTGNITNVTGIMLEMAVGRGVSPAHIMRLKLADSV